jgi:hypothetical protein
MPTQAENSDVSPGVPLAPDRTEVVALMDLVTRLGKGEVWVRAFSGRIA